jgi:molecular chaperone DnaJ
MAKRDYYEVLGVDRSAQEQDIKRAYRKLALELHPDRNPGNAEAEEKFKEASEAFAVLCDAEKRAAYDRFGHAGVAGAGQGFNDISDIFSQFGDIFSDFFGGGGGGGFRSGRRGGPQRGADLRTTVVLPLKEAAFGVKREIPLNHPGPCETCDGSGAEGGKRTTCSRCKGAGQVALQRGPFYVQTACPGCRGMGSIAENACKSCQGTGQMEVSRTVKVTFPAGIDEGQTLRVPGQGLSGTQGGPAGHLFVDVGIDPDPRFERDGADLVHGLTVTFPQATLGAELEVPTLDGEPAKVKLPAGIQPGETVVLRGQGIPHLSRGGRGNLVVVVQLGVPKKVSKKAKKLLEELQTELDS